MTARPHIGRRIATKLRRKPTARPRRASTALKEETKMDLPPQAVPVMRGHDRGKPALAPYNEGTRCRTIGIALQCHLLAPAGALQLDLSGAVPDHSVTQRAAAAALPAASGRSDAE